MSWETERTEKPTEYVDSIGQHPHPFPGNELAEDILNNSQLDCPVDP